ncbi:MAG: hypothetical protein EXR62_08690 [Chloroflexi bacterium]|nr:hypothetical protein [Chloroflexota bacterium]
MKSGVLFPGKEISTLGSVLHHDPAWRAKQLLNAIGAVITAIVTVVFLLSKFTQGAWVTMLLIPGLLALFFRIHTHYQHVAAVMSTAGTQEHPHRRHIQTIVLIENIHRESMRLIDYAKSLEGPWKAVHVAVYPERIPEIKRKWAERIGEGHLIILPSPYRRLSLPIRQYVEKLLQEDPDGFVNVVIGELVTGSPLTQILHQNSHFIQQLALQDLDGVVITIVPVQLRKLEENQEHHSQNRGSNAVSAVEALGPNAANGAAQNGNALNNGNAMRRNGVSSENNKLHRIRAVRRIAHIFLHREVNSRYEYVFRVHG